MSTLTAERPVRIRPRMTCPHCWTNFATEDVLWIAEHDDLRGDPLLNDDAKLRFLPTRFDVAGNALDARGLACQAIACPRCHLRMPRVLVELTPWFVSILGIPACGKTYFLASMTWKLRQSMPRYFQLSFTDADPESNTILNQYENEQFLNPDREAVVKLRKTEHAQGDWYEWVRFGGQTVAYPKPFLFSIQPLAGHPSAAESDVARALCLYDNSGESFLPRADQAATPVTRHLARSNVLFFLFDPTKDPRFRAACAGKTRDPQMLVRSKRGDKYEGELLHRQDVVLNEAANRIRKLTDLKHGQRHTRPLIVVVTKYDAWSALLPGVIDTPPFRPPKQGPMHALDWNRVADVSRQVRELLWEHSPEIVSAAEGFAQDVLYVPVSATGCPPVPSAEGGIAGVRVGDIRPLWVEVPMLAALARWGRKLVPYAMRKPGR